VTWSEDDGSGIPVLQVGIQHPTPDALPCQVVCATCGWTNVIDAEELRLDVVGPLVNFPDPDDALCPCCRGRGAGRAAKRALDRALSQAFGQQRG
jgi:hypothetical protein